MFCIKLHFNEEPSPSEFILGGCDIKAEKWIPVASRYLWTVTLTKIVLASITDGSKQEISPMGEATFDTGGILSRICGTKLNFSF